MCPQGASTFQPGGLAGAKQTEQLAESAPMLTATPLRVMIAAVLFTAANVTVVESNRRGEKTVGRKVPGRSVVLSSLTEFDSGLCGKFWQWPRTNIIVSCDYLWTGRDLESHFTSEPLFNFCQPELNLEARRR